MAVTVGHVSLSRASLPHPTPSLLPPLTVFLWFNHVSAPPLFFGGEGGGRSLSLLTFTPLPPPPCCDTRFTRALSRKRCQGRCVWTTSVFFLLLAVVAFNLFFSSPLPFVPSLCSFPSFSIFQAMFNYFFLAGVSYRTRQAPPHFPRYAIAMPPECQKLHNARSSHARRTRYMGRACAVLSLGVR